MSHVELTSKADFDKALQTPGKYVLIYAYENEVDPKAEEYAKKFSDSTDAYKVDVIQHVAAKEYFNITATPAVIVYKDGQEITKVVGMTAAGMEQVASILG